MAPDEATQLQLGSENEPAVGRVKVLAGILAGFRFGGMSLDRLTTVRRREVYEIARDTLKRLQEVE